MLAVRICGRRRDLISPDVFQVLNFHEEKFTLGDFLETQKQSALEEAEKLESEPQERTRTVVKLTEGLRLIAVLINVFKGIDSNGQRAAETRLGIIRMLAGYDKTLQRRGFCLARLQCLISSSHFLILALRHMHCWTMKMKTHMIRAQFKLMRLFFWTVIGLSVFVPSARFS